jgi:hypothetical protein
MSKHVSGFFGIGTMMEHWDQWDHSRCPCCNHEREDKTHLLTCPDPGCANAWNESLLGLEAWMQDTDTAPAIQSCFLQTLASRQPTQTFSSLCDHSILQAALAQDAIGWLHTTEGKISHQWHTIQAAHYISLNSTLCPRKWAAGLVTNLLNVTHAQWIHRNSILHERNEDGLKLKEGQELTVAIHTQFALGLDDLHPRDHHYITRGLDHILSLPAANKKAWLSGIKIARESYSTCVAREHDSMRACMNLWLHPANP